ncbi:hypothetical protein BC936DRAFT_143610 [Jimgerdemannia flammicorona]|uniref:Uncharacterized protein n=1 Tax=Jimgerdemannia flammicorona TaxID=994334 RepID=A0A432ZYP5_9FUNG|nr:hypothetical protein BC936DRAFT_143610 [Jimgerdemannia flammicorona]
MWRQRIVSIEGADNVGCQSPTVDIRHPFGTPVHITVEPGAPFGMEVDPHLRRSVEAGGEQIPSLPSTDLPPPLTCHDDDIAMSE